MRKHTVTFKPDNKTVEVARDTTILEAALSCGVYINSSCGGDGVCGRCKVKLLNGSLASQPSPALSLAEKQDRIYLACLSAVQSDVEVEVLAESRLDFESLSPEELAFRLKGMYSKAEDIEVAQPGQPQEAFAGRPLARKVYLELPAPTMDDRLSDLERLYRGLGHKEEDSVLETTVATIRPLGAVMRDSGWKVTAALGERGAFTELLQVSSGDTTKQVFGIAFDIGTTTITGQLIDMRTREVIATKAAYNRQASFGSDVITRIIYARKANGLEQLHDAVTDTMNQIIRELVAGCELCVNDLCYVVTAGNTTMLHLLMSIDPAYIRRDPYTPVANFLPVTRAAEAGLQVTPHGLLYCVPGVASYVGGDIVAGVLASGLYRDEGLSLLIDIGTNGEIVLGNKDFMVCCAASAGPAFEGSGVSCGMRASRGAIQQVKLSPGTLHAHYSTIAGEPARGICGSGYIALLNELLKAGVIDKGGRIKIEHHERVRLRDGAREFVLAGQDSAAGSADIAISEADIENLKRAKAAVYAAVSVLTKYMDLRVEDITKVYLAGGFGTYVDVESAVGIGLLPDLNRSCLHFIGNTSLAGARQILLSTQARDTAGEIANKMTYLELSVHPGYMDEYMAALFFPHTDANRFPSIKY